MPIMQKNLLPPSCVGLSVSDAHRIKDVSSNSKVVSSTARQSLRRVLREVTEILFRVLVPIIKQFCSPPSSGIRLIDGTDVKDDSPSSWTLAFYEYRMNLRKEYYANAGRILYLDSNKRHPPGHRFEREVQWGSDPVLCLRGHYLWKNQPVS